MSTVTSIVVRHLNTVGITTIVKLPKDFVKNESE